MDNPRFRPALGLGKSEVGDYGLEKKSYIFRIQANEDRPALKDEIDGIDVPITGDFFQKYGGTGCEIVRRNLSA
jgi:hypothetical protein